MLRQFRRHLAALTLLCALPMLLTHTADGAYIQGRVQKQQVFTSSGTFVPSAALLAAGGWVDVRIVAGGGGGGGPWVGNGWYGGSCTAGSVVCGSYSGGGGGGAVVEKKLQVTGNTTVIVASGGSGGNLAMPGGWGGNSSFGSVSANGGNGGYTTTGYLGIGGTSGNYSGGLGPAGGGAGGPGQFQVTQNGSTANIGQMSISAGGPGLNGYGGGGGGWPALGGTGTSIGVFSAGANGGGAGTNIASGGISGLANTGSGGGGIAIGSNSTSGVGTIYGSTTTSAATGTGVSFTLTSTTGMTPGDVLQIDSECIYVSSISSNTITGLRGFVCPQSGSWGAVTSNVSHASGAAVTWSMVVVPAWIYNNLDGGTGTTLTAPGVSVTAATSATQTTITATTAWPANGTVMQMDLEQIQITAGGGTTTATVTRGYNSTTAANHAASTAAWQISGITITIQQCAQGVMGSVGYWLATGSQFWQNQELYTVTSGWASGSSCSGTITISRAANGVSGMGGSSGFLIGSNQTSNSLNNIPLTTQIIPATGVLPYIGSISVSNNSTIANLYTGSGSWTAPETDFITAGAGTNFLSVTRGYNGTSWWQRNAGTGGAIGGTGVFPGSWVGTSNLGSAIPGSLWTGGNGGSGIVIVTWWE